MGQCYLATEAYAFLQKEQIDLLFLDINMPKLKGLDFLRTLDQRPQVIITSAYEEYALEGYELQVCDYLLKPFRFDRFLKAVKLAHQQVFTIVEPVSTSSIETNETQNIFIKVDKRLIQINLAEIHYLESYGNYVKIWMGDQFHLTARTLSSFEAELSVTHFLRIHKSFILQRQFINYLEGQQIAMKNGKLLPIGKNYRSVVKEWLR